MRILVHHFERFEKVLGRRAASRLFANSCESETSKRNCRTARNAPTELYVGVPGAAWIIWDIAQNPRGDGLPAQAAIACKRSRQQSDNTELVGAPSSHDCFEEKTAVVGRGQDCGGGRRCERRQESSKHGFISEQPWAAGPA
eukprot:2560232-Pleurochrysis_carterae.AAC.1